MKWLYRPGTIGGWPSGKATLFGSVYRRFESYHPSHRRLSININVLDRVSSPSFRGLEVYFDYADTSSACDEAEIMISLESGFAR